MLTGCNYFQIWPRVLCVEMKGLVSTDFLCKLASSILSFILASPGLCHSPAFLLPAHSPGGETACPVPLSAILLSPRDTGLSEFALGMRRVLKGTDWSQEDPLVMWVAS